MKKNFTEIEEIIENRIAELSKEYDLDRYDIEEIRTEAYRENGWSYGDYLGALLFIHGSENARKGLMDVMESDIRKTPGNSRFRIDGLIDGMEAKISVTSSYSGDFEITRVYEYE